jgi:hypothetical protein
MRHLRRREISLATQSNPERASHVTGKYQEKIRSWALNENMLYEFIRQDVVTLQVIVVQH